MEFIMKFTDAMSDFASPMVKLGTSLSTTISTNAYWQLSNTILCFQFQLFGSVHLNLFDMEAIGLTV